MNDLTQNAPACPCGAQPVQKDISHGVLWECPEGLHKAYAMWAPRRPDWADDEYLKRTLIRNWSARARN